MMWTPYQIEIVLHHHCSSASFPRSDAPAYEGTVNALLQKGVLTQEGGRLETTECGKKLVDLWCKTPVPISVWIDPREMRDAP